MKALPLLLLVICSRAVIGQMATNESVTTAEGGEAVKAYRDFRFLSVPPGIGEVSWQVTNGKLQFRDGQSGSWVNPPTSFLDDAVSGEWDGLTVGGAPAIGRDPFFVPYTLGPEYTGRALALLGERIIEIGSRRVQSRPGHFVPEVLITARGETESAGSRITSFRGTYDLFQFRLGSAFLVSDSVLAIIAGTQHPDFSTLTLVDLQSGKPVGSIGFSALQYLAKEKAFWIAKPVTKAKMISEPDAVARAKAEAVTLPVFIDGKINPELVDDEAFVLLDSVGSPAAPQFPQQDNSPGSQSNSPAPGEQRPTEQSPPVPPQPFPNPARVFWIIGGGVLLLFIVVMLVRSKPRD